MDDLEEQAPRVEKGACKNWNLSEFYKLFHGPESIKHDAPLDNCNVVESHEMNNDRGRKDFSLSRLKIKWRAIPLRNTEQLSTTKQNNEKNNINNFPADKQDSYIESISEGSCPSFEESFEEFFRWRAGAGEDSVFAKIHAIFGDRIAFYADYLHFPALQQQFQDIYAKEAINTSFFSEFGLWEDVVLPSDAADRENLTLWVGTKGAHSPLHYDAYCDNYICQVRGSKRWRLWPPTADIISRRIPYEESSIYGEVYQGDQNILPTPALDIVLEEGDLLVLPKHWWHYVETISDESMSVNMWVNRESDQDDRLTEAIVRFAAMGLADAGSRGLGQGFEGLANWLAPSELETCQGRSEESISLNSEQEQCDDSVKIEATNLNSRSADSQLGLLNHGENVACLVDSLLECLDSRGLSDFRNVDPGKVLRLIVSELLRPEAIIRCSDRLLDPAADIWQDS